MPPPMARAIGLEIKKSVLEVDSKDELRVENSEQKQEMKEVVKDERKEEEMEEDQVPSCS